MSLLDTAKASIQRITTDTNGFGVSMVMIAPDGTTKTVTGLHTKHHINVDTDGDQVNSKNAHISISEAVLTSVGYPVRNADQEVNLKGHRVNVADSTGIVKNYVIQEWFPDERIGLIVCILGDYEL